MEETGWNRGQSRVEIDFRVASAVELLACDPPPRGFNVHKPRVTVPVVSSVDIFYMVRGVKSRIYPKINLTPIEYQVQPRK
jgi:hypothetical protein